MSYCDTLRVEIDGVTVGWLHQPAKTVNISFRYDEGWLAKGRPPISLGLPLKEEPFDREATENFFGNLTPDGQALMVISSYKRLSSGNIFSFLKNFGAEASGALTIFPADQKPPSGGGLYRDVTDLVLKSLRNVDGGLKNLVIDTNSKVSLAGAQNKLPVLLDGERLLVAAPDSNAPTSHIVKPESPSFADLQFRTCRKIT
jgi:serine/threonine-protein kinase HipA